MPKIWREPTPLPYEEVALNLAFRGATIVRIFRDFRGDGYIVAEANPQFDSVQTIYNCFRLENEAQGMTNVSTLRRCVPFDERPFQPIGSAPRDGTLIEVMDDEIGPLRMWWHDGKWRTGCGTVVWSDCEGRGPTHWQLIAKARPRAPFPRRGMLRQ